MSVPTVMRWDHKNAPQIINMRDWTQIRNWYQTIFVDGYLADDDITLIPPLDWEIIFDDVNFIVDMRADVNGLNDGSINRMYILIKYESVVNNGYHGCRVRSWIHYGSTQLSNTGEYDRKYGCPVWYGNNNMGTDRACPWIVIGNNRGVYFLGGYNGSITYPNIPTNFSTSNDYSTWQYFGDFVNDGVDYGKDNQCCTYGYDGEELYNTSYYYSNQVDTLSQWRYTSGKQKIYYADNNDNYLGIHVVKDELGILRGMNYTAVPFGFFSGSRFIGRTKMYDLPYPYIDGGLKIIPHDLYVRNNLATPEDDKVNAVYIGKMPGLYFPMHNSPLATPYNLVEFEGTGPYEDQHFIGLAKLNYDEFYINITEDWGI